MTSSIDDYDATLLPQIIQRYPIPLSVFDNLAPTNKSLHHFHTSFTDPISWTLTSSFDSKLLFLPPPHIGYEKRFQDQWTKDVNNQAATAHFHNYFIAHYQGVSGNYFEFPINNKVTMTPHPQLVDFTSPTSTTTSPTTTLLQSLELFRSYQRVDMAMDDFIFSASPHLNNPTHSLVSQNVLSIQSWLKSILSTPLRRPGSNDTSDSSTNTMGEKAGESSASSEQPRPNLNAISTFSPNPTLQQQVYMMMLVATYAAIQHRAITPLCFPSVPSPTSSTVHITNPTSSTSSSPHQTSTPQSLPSTPLQHIQSLMRELNYGFFESYKCNPPPSTPTSALPTIHSPALTLFDYPVLRPQVPFTFKSQHPSQQSDSAQPAKEEKKQTYPNFAVDVGSKANFILDIEDNRVVDNYLSLPCLATNSSTTTPDFSRFIYSSPPLANPLTTCPSDYALLKSVQDRQVEKVLIPNHTEKGIKGVSYAFFCLQQLNSYSTIPQSIVNSLASKTNSSDNDNDNDNQATSTFTHMSTFNSTTPFSQLSTITSLDDLNQQAQQADQQIKGVQSELLSTVTHSRPHAQQIYTFNYLKTIKEAIEFHHKMDPSKHYATPTSFQLSSAKSMDTFIAAKQKQEGYMQPIPNLNQPPHISHFYANMKSIYLKPVQRHFQLSCECCARQYNGQATSACDNSTIQRQQQQQQQEMLPTFALCHRPQLSLHNLYNQLSRDCLNTDAMVAVSKSTNSKKSTTSSKHLKFLSKLLSYYRPQHAGLDVANSFQNTDITKTSTQHSHKELSTMIPYASTGVYRSQYLLRQRQQLEKTTSSNQTIPTPPTVHKQPQNAITPPSISSISSANVMNVPYAAYLLDMLISADTLIDIQPSTTTTTTTTTTTSAQITYPSSLDSYCYSLLTSFHFMLKSSRTGTNFMFPLPISTTTITRPTPSPLSTPSAPPTQPQPQPQPQQTRQFAPLSSPFIISFLFILYRCFNQVSICLSYSLGYPIYIVACTGLLQAGSDFLTIPLAVLEAQQSFTKLNLNLHAPTTTATASTPSPLQDQHQHQHQLSSPCLAFTSLVNSNAIKIDRHFTKFIGDVTKLTSHYISSLLTNIAQNFTFLLTTSYISSTVVAQHYSNTALLIHNVKAQVIDNSTKAWAILADDTQDPELALQLLSDNDQPASELSYHFQQFIPQLKRAVYLAYSTSFNHQVPKQLGGLTLYAGDIIATTLLQLWKVNHFSSQQQTPQ